jgi:hypothetical protein
MRINDQAALGFIESQTAHIEQGVNEIVYADIQYQSLIPVDTSAHPFAQSVVYYSSDKYGRAAWLNGGSDDMPKAGTERFQYKTSVYTAGIGYGYSWEEVNIAMMQGVNLQNDDAMAARRAYEEMVDNVALRGDTEKNFRGLFNFPGVTVSVATTGNWPTATVDQINLDISNLLIGIGTTTLQTSMANTLLMSYERFQLLSARRIDNTVVSIMEYIRQNNVYTAMTGKPLDIRAVRGLETAGVGSVQRMIAYRKAPDVLKMHIPMPHRFLGVWQSGPLNWEIPGVFRIGGLDIRRPREVRYVDGV